MAKMEFLFKTFALCSVMFKIHCLLICTDPNLLKHVKNGEKLEGYVIETVFTSLTNCGKECVYQANCLSFNFNTQSGRCEINRNVTSSSAPLISSPGFLYSEKHYWRNVITNPCQNVTCEENEKCMVENNTSICIKYDCNIPPELAYSNKLVYSGTVTGYDAVYSCSGPGTVREEVTLACNSNGQWVGGHCRKISSCLQIKQCKKNYTDGEYWLYPLPYRNTERVKIYCYGLNTETPVEYVTLVNENIVESGNTLVEFTGGYTKCVSKSTQNEQFGAAKFLKIRVHTYMYVNTSDLRFTSDLVGKQQYGVTYDCTSDNVLCDNFTRGYAKIDTSHTGLIVSRNAEWKVYGWQPIQWYFNRSSDQLIEMLCSGHCGGCRPHGEIKLVLDTSVDIPINSAIEVNC